MLEPRKLFGGLGNRMFQMAYIYNQVKKGHISDIYIQDFSQIGEEIREWYGEGIGFMPYVAVHVRRGDYTNNTFYVDLTQTDYYEKALDMFPHSKFLVFCADRQQGSDDQTDMEWCKEWFKEKFPSKHFEFWQGENEIEDMNMMASCSSQIIANSSFSAWAGFLNPNPSKIVVAPKKWFADEVQRITLPSNFTLI